MTAPGLPPQFRHHAQQADLPKVKKNVTKWLLTLFVAVVAAVAVAIGLMTLTPDLVAKNGEEIGNSNAIVVAQQQQQQRSQAPSRPGSAPAAPAAPSAPAAPATAAQSPAPQRTERIVYDAWTLTCTQTGNDPKKVCSAILQVAEQQNRRVVFAWLVGRTPEGALTTVFRTPTGVQLQKGVELKIGNAPSRRASYVICAQQACEASLTMDDGVVREAMSALNGNAVATLTIADGRAINFTMPIKGIDKVIAAMGR